MADLDYVKLRVIPGNYDEFLMLASAQATEKDDYTRHAKGKKKNTSELQDFVRQVLP